jgi:hypothetical protein
MIAVAQSEPKEQEVRPESNLDSSSLSVTHMLRKGRSTYAINLKHAPNAEKG